MPRPAPAVSVVIPTRDRAHLICDALDSVRAQTFQDLEIVVIDDGSEDDTAARVHQWAATCGDRLRYLEQWPRGGGNAARNEGIRAARGRYVAFLDSDDVWDPRKLERQMAAIGRRPGHGAVYCGLREVDAESGAVLRVLAGRWPEGDLSRQLLVRDVTAPTSTYLVERSVLIDAGLFDLDLAARQDWDMWIRVAQRTRIACVQDALVDLRHHGGPRTASDPTRELRAHRRILEKYAPLRHRHGVRLRLQALAAFHRRTGRVHLNYMDARGGAIRHHLAALALWPVSPDGWAALIGAVLPRTLRRTLRRRWNAIFEGTPLAVRSH